MKLLFCGICCIFGCGIHSYKQCNILKFTEDSSCQCRVLLQQIKEMPKTTSNEASNLSKHLVDLQKKLKKLVLKSCVTHVILLRYCLDNYPKEIINQIEDTNNNLINPVAAKMSGFVLACFATIKLPIKKVLQSTSFEKDSKQFYEPCNHKGLCQK